VGEGDWAIEETVQKDADIKLLLIRHCESVFNVNQQSKKLNVPLSIKGRIHAQTLKIPASVSRVVCSPLRRCLDTVKLSTLELVHQKEVQSLCREHRTDPCDFLHGESVETESEASVIRRVDEFKEWLREQHAAEPQASRSMWAIVGHADFFFYFTGNLCTDDGEYYGQWLDNGQLLEWTLRSGSMPHTSPPLSPSPPPPPPPPPPPSPPLAAEEYKELKLSTEEEQMGASADD